MLFDYFTCGIIIETSTLDQDPEEEKAEQKELTEKFKPLLEYLKKQADKVVRDGMDHQILVTRQLTKFSDGSCHF